MENYTAIRKDRRGGNKHIAPVIGLGLPLGEFCFYEPTLELLKLNRDSQALMFYIDKANRKVKVEIEEKQDDNYHLTTSKRSYSRFTSKPLGVMFAEVFELNIKSKTFFHLKEIEKGVFQLEME